MTSNKYNNLIENLMFVLNIKDPTELKYIRDLEWSLESYENFVSKFKLSPIEKIVFLYFISPKIVDDGE